MTFGKFVKWHLLATLCLIPFWLGIGLVLRALGAR